MPSKKFAGRYASLEKIADFIAQAAQEAGFDNKGIYAITEKEDEGALDFFGTIGLGIPERYITSIMISSLLMATGTGLA